MLSTEQANDIDYIKKILSDSFEIKTIKIMHSPNTYNSFAYEINDEIIVRFPCRGVAIKKLIKEHNILSFLKNKTSLEIPYTELSETPYLYAWHKKINGNHLTQKELSTWRTEKKEAFYKDIATFIHELNQTSDDILREIELPSWNKFEKMDSAEKIANFYRTRNEFSKDENIFIQNFLNRFELKNQNETIKFCHFDIMGKNMAINHNTEKLIGIYDFGECAMGDVHIEFSQTALNFNYDTIIQIAKEYEKLSNIVLDIDRIEGYSFYTWLEFFYRFNSSEMGINGIKSKIKDIQEAKAI